MNEKYIDERIKKLVEEHNAIVDAEAKLDKDRQEMEVRRIQIIGSINELRSLKEEMNKSNEKDNKKTK